MLTSFFFIPIRVCTCSKREKVACCLMSSVHYGLIIVILVLWVYASLILPSQDQHLWTYGVLLRVHTPGFEFKLISMGGLINCFIKCLLCVNIWLSPDYKLIWLSYSCMPMVMVLFIWFLLLLASFPMIYFLYIHSICISFYAVSLCQLSIHFSVYAIFNMSSVCGYLCPLCVNNMLRVFSQGCFSLITTSIPSYVIKVTDFFW